MRLTRTATVLRSRHGKKLCLEKDTCAPAIFHLNLHSLCLGTVVARLLTGLLLLPVFPSMVAGYESDQFSNRLQTIEDSTSVMNHYMTLTIAQTMTRLYRTDDKKKIVDRLYDELGGFFWIDKMEHYLMTSSDIERLETPRYGSIYAGIPIYKTGISAIFGVGPTIKVNNVFVGTDKFGHFISQGRKFYRRMLKMNDESLAAERSAYTERVWFGVAVTGSYSNADLVANYEGYRFFRSLFEDNVIVGKPAILGWQNGHWIMQRPFDWADHVNDYWDEALNVNYYDAELYASVKKRLIRFCHDYDSAPQLYEVHDEPVLKARYRNLQLRDNSALRLENLCGQAGDDVVGTAGSAALNANASPQDD